MNFIRFLIKESVFITRIVYLFYLILLGIFCIIIGFLLGVYKHDDEINAFLLLLLLKTIYNNGFDDVLLEYLHELSLKYKTAEQISKISLKTVKQINPCPLKIVLKEPDQITQIPLPILSDPFVLIDIEFIWKESKNYTFELVKFYRNVNQKVK